MRPVQALTEESELPRTGQHGARCRRPRGLSHVLGAVGREGGRGVRLEMTGRLAERSWWASLHVSCHTRSCLPGTAAPQEDHGPG